MNSLITYFAAIDYFNNMVDKYFINEIITSLYVKSNRNNETIGKKHITILQKESHFKILTVKHYYEIIYELGVVDDKGFHGYNGITADDILWIIKNKSTPEHFFSKKKLEML
jgi:hypothetical protein